MSNGTITAVKGRQVLDCNGRPVVEVDIRTAGGQLGRAGASTGSSVGANESFVLRDNDPSLFSGMSVYKAIDNVNTVLGPALMGMDVTDQAAIDKRMIELDGTRYKTNLGGNAIYATSVAAARAAAAVKNVPLYQSVATGPIQQMFAVSSNLVNGGTYVDKTLAFQEFMVLPYGVEQVSDAVRIVVEVFTQLGKVIQKANGRSNMGNYSGYGAPSDDPLEVFQMMSLAVEQAGYKDHVVYSMDCAASEFYDEKAGGYRFRGDIIDRATLLGILKKITETFPIAYIEDALEEEDFEGYALASKMLNTVIVGDDFLCTSLDRAQKAVAMGAARGMIFKPNQAGTITESLETARYMMEQNMVVIPSGRAGGVLDSPEKEIGLGIGCKLIKSGAPRSGSRTAGYNFAMRAAEELSLTMVNIKTLPQFSHLL